MDSEYHAKSEYVLYDDYNPDYKLLNWQILDVSDLYSREYELYLLVDH